MYETNAIQLHFLLWFFWYISQWSDWICSIFCTRLYSKDIHCASCAINVTSEWMALFSSYFSMHGVLIVFITVRWPIVRCGRWNLFWPFMASRYHYWIQPNQWIMLTAHVTYGLLDFSKTFWSTIHKNTSTILDTNKQTTDSSYVGFLTVGSDPEGNV